MRRVKTFGAVEQSCVSGRQSRCIRTRMRQVCRRPSCDESQFHERFGDVKIGYLSESGRESEVLPFAAGPADAEKIRMPLIVRPRGAAERVERNGHRRAPDFFG